jgi:glycerate-2-kinase
VVVGLDSDGTDGPTDIAGGIIDNQTLARANALGMKLFASLARHDVSPVFKKLGDAIETGATGTNVNDLKFLLIS